MKKQIILAIVILQCLPIFSNETMKITIDNISIETPIGWLAQYTSSPQLFFLYSPMEANDTFQENCNLTIENLPSPYTIQEYKDASVAAIESIYSTFQLLESNENYHIITGFIGDVNLKQIQYFYIKSNIAYILTFSSNPDNFDRYKDQFKSIAKTFLY